MTTAQDEFDELFRDKHTSSRRHPEDETTSPPASDTEPSGHNSETFYEHDDLDVDTYTPSSNMHSRYFVPRQRSEANTGPKGVIADAQAFEQAKRSRFNLLRSSPPRDSSQNNKKTLSPPTSKFWGSRSNSRARRTSSSEEEEEDDDSFMVQWRQRRLKELQTTSTHKKAHSTNLQVRMYGRLISVDAEGFLEAVECTPADTVVAVYIYDDMVCVLTLPLI